MQNSLFVDVERLSGGGMSLLDKPFQMFEKESSQMIGTTQAVKLYIVEGFAVNCPWCHKLYSSR